MKEYYPIFICLIKFFSVYLLLTGIYYFYLNYYQIQLQTCDPFTKIVAVQASSFLNWFGITSEAIYVNSENYMRFFINKKLTSIVNEGCNALSVIFLYVSFIIAFSNSFKKTFLYLFFSILFIHFINIIRIAAINYIYYFHPKYGNDSHDYFFPIVLYGLVIILWLGWIKYFIFKKKN